MRGSKLTKRQTLFWQVMGVVAVLALWQAATLFFPPLVLPTIKMVLTDLRGIITGPKFLKIVWTTVSRFLAGLAIGIAAGFVFGLLTGVSDRAKAMFSPVQSVLQTVPPVCWVVLALVWFGFNGKPCVFIVATATVPTIVINISNGVRNIDKDLLEMAELYDFSREEKLKDVILPSVRPYLVSAIEIVVGGGWKLAVMGEVLTTSSGIGGEITKARLNIEPALIIAWALILVVFSFLTSRILTSFLSRGKRRRRHAQD